MDVSKHYGQPLYVSTSLHHATSVVCLENKRSTRKMKLTFLVTSAFLVVAQTYCCCSVGYATLYNVCATGTVACQKGMWCTDALALTADRAKTVYDSSGTEGFGTCTACGGWDDQTVALVSQDDFLRTCTQVTATCTGPSAALCSPQATAAQAQQAAQALQAAVQAAEAAAPASQQAAAAAVVQAKQAFVTAKAIYEDSLIYARRFLECSSCQHQVANPTLNPLPKFRTLHEVFKLRVGLMFFHDYLGLILCGGIVVLTLLDELHEIRLVEIAVKTTLKKSRFRDLWMWLLAVEWLCLARRYVVLPLIYALALLFALVLGTDSYNLALNTLVLLFIAQVDNRATHSAQLPGHAAHSAPLKPLRCVCYRWTTSCTRAWTRSSTWRSSSRQKGTTRLRMMMGTRTQGSGSKWPRPHRRSAHHHQTEQLRTHGRTTTTANDEFPTTAREPPALPTGGAAAQQQQQLQQRHARSLLQLVCSS